MTTTDDLYPVPRGLESRVAETRRATIDLTQAEMAKGRRIARAVVSAVEALSDNGHVPRLLAGEPFTAGSFGRRTQAQPLDDIDIFFPLDAAALQSQSPTGVPTPERLVSRSADHALGCRAELWNATWLDSGKTLDAAVAGLSKIALAATDIGKNPRGRCAHLTLEGINVDLVFVLWSDVTGAMDRYHLPSGAGWAWRTANPKDDQRRLTEANRDQHSGLLLPTVRALKAWNDHVCSGRLKSIHLEVLAVEAIFSQVQISSVVSALTYAFHQLGTALQRRCPDPTGLGPDLDANLHPDDRAWVAAQAGRSAAEAIAANAVGQTETAEGAARWARILLADGAPAPERARGGPPLGRHDAEFGQPAHKCEAPAGIPIPEPRREERPARAVDQRGRRGEYA